MYQKVTDDSIHLICFLQVFWMQVWENTHLNKFSSAVNIPPLHCTTFKTHEKEISNY